MKKIFVIITVVSLVSCGVINRMKSFSKCDFKLKSIENINLAGVKIKDLNSIDKLNFFELAKIAAAYSSKNLPLSLTVNIFATNPNTSPAAMTKMDWILNIDSTQVANGTLNKRIDVPANGGSTTFPVEIKTDLMKFLNGQLLESLQNLGIGLSGSNNKTNSRISFKVKPYITIAGVSIPYPNYYTIDSM